MADKLLKFEQNSLQKSFIGNHTKDFLVSEFENIQQRIEKSVIREVQKAMKFGDSQKLYERLEKLGKTEKRFIKTVANTARDGLSQAQKIQDAENAEIGYFKYVGPEGNARKFCQDRIGKVYSKTEIESMNNGHGLPVLYYCGGWNCRHRWVAVADFLTVALEHQKRDLPYNEKDLRDDAKHLNKLRISNIEDYFKEAQQVVRNAKEIYGHSYYGNEYQFEYLGAKGNVVVDFKGDIRGYFAYILDREGDINYNLNKVRNTWKKLL